MCNGKNVGLEERLNKVQKTLLDMQEMLLSASSEVDEIFMELDGEQNESGIEE